jgi:hypothetical protein
LFLWFPPLKRRAIRAKFYSIGKRSGTTAMVPAGRDCRHFVGALGALCALLSCAAYGGIAPAGPLPNSPVTLAPCGPAAEFDFLTATSCFGDYRAVPLFTVEAIQPRHCPKPALAESSLRELPPAPSSMGLVLSALASLGAYHGLRSFKRLHVSFAPDWYHTGAVQVGHATPFDLDFGALPLRIFEEPSAAPDGADRIYAEAGARFISQVSLLVESPRGPPLR